MAVDLAKLSLWLATLAKDHAFTFLDHASATATRWSGSRWPRSRRATGRTTSSGAIRCRHLERRVAEVMKRRQEILTADESPVREAAATCAMQADEPLDLRPLPGRLASSASSSRAARPRPRSGARGSGITIREYLGRRGRHAHPRSPAARDRAGRWTLARVEPPVEPFHWEVEFPEVFLPRRTAR